ncbi:MAG TPA: hypothetical protein VFJ85_18420 [Acidimicrobiales bacterium]|nr:hypothetical protein [Acidimicrobiales bacterium]
MVIRRGRRRALVVLVPAVAGVLCAMGAAPATGLTTTAVDATCTHPVSLTFSPGLGLVARPTTFAGTGASGPCVSSQVVSATMSLSGSGTLGCFSGSASGTVRFDWVTTTGGTTSSEATVSATSAGLLGGAALAGQVTEGLFKGDSYSVAFAGNPAPLAGCLTASGLDHYSGSATFTFTRPLV